MASSPPPAAYTQSPTALSPPHPAYTHIFPTATTPTAAPAPSAKSKKRPSIADGAGSTPSLKRRKASIMSIASTGSAHPLRQTSFPPEDIGGPRSPSVDIDAMSIVSGSQVSAVGSAAGLPGKKKRGRKSKADKAREARDQTPSLINGRLGTGSAAGGGGGGSVASGAGGGGTADGRSTTGGQGGDQAEDDDDENDVVHMSITSTRRSEAQTAEEKRLRAMLTRCMDTDQFDRYGNWRAAKLPDQVVRRVVNATVSQSVPSQIVIAVRTVTKFYLCDIIRIAREVQAEWIAAGAEVQAASFTEDENGHIVLDEEMPWPGKVMSAEEEEEQTQAAAEAEGAGGNSFTESSAGMPTQATMSFGSRNEELDRQTREVILREPPRGPLRPEHLREALRRYQASAQSQGIGSLRVWQEQQKSGVERFPSRTGGRRIFK
ncbi:hypothetical protein MAPG_09598 [Magnaporthiopsis poae ATCC 64411]|uniref:TAFII28-like protein domain-containing protein n=1 Tax=Magnaporthiopsis poae (strain ATCC 64411 / 73-15) TaxID=644358 RepID=A0A0C4EAD0_MAGP6|nr:hypothetical protein MAPG_09598 [Magnaporthiopsis poae ATCC 64411]